MTVPVSASTPLAAVSTAGLADRLREVMTSLAGPREGIETAFVDVGGRLVQCAGLLNRVTTTFEALPHDLESPELTEATDRLAAIGQRAREISLSFADEQAAIARMVEVVAIAGHPIAELRKAVRMMGIVAINARVVAAGVIDGQNGFDVFTTDIATLSDSATRTIQDFSRTYEQLSEDVRRAAQQRAAFEAMHRDTLTSVAAQLDENLAAVTRHRQASADGSAETGRLSRDIATRIGAAVMAMQVGDATRQRLEHIETGLGSAADLLTASAGAGDDLAIVDAISALEAAQLAGATDNFALEMVDAERALQELAGSARTVMTRSQELYGQTEQRGQSSLATLGAEMRHAAAVLRDCETERQKLDQVAADVGVTVKVLLDHVEAVQNIEANMRLVSLNAAIKCAQLGTRGRALNVIAQQLRELTGGTVIAAEAAMSSLATAATLAQSFADAATGEAAGQIGRLEQEANSSIALLETVDRRLSDALGVLDAAGPTVIVELDKAAMALSGHAEIAEAMADAQFQIAGLSGADGKPVDAHNAAVSQMFAALQRNYTMEAERALHHQIAGTQPGEAPAAPAAASDDTEIDGMFF